MITRTKQNSLYLWPLRWDPWTKKQCRVQKFDVVTTCISKWVQISHRVLLLWKVARYETVTTKMYFGLNFCSTLHCEFKKWTTFHLVKLFVFLVPHSQSIESFTLGRFSSSGGGVRNVRLPLLMFTLPLHTLSLSLSQNKEEGSIVQSEKVQRGSGYHSLNDSSLVNYPCISAALVDSHFLLPHSSVPVNSSTPHNATT